MSHQNKYKKQQFYEIWLPIISATIVCLSLLVIAVFTSASGSVSIGTLTDISIVLIILPSLLIFILLIGSLVFLGWGVGKLNASLSPLFEKGQKFASSLSGKIQKVAIFVVRPVIKIKSAGTALHTLVIKIFDCKSDSEEKWTKIQAGKIG